MAGVIWLKNNCHLFHRLQLFSPWALCTWTTSYQLGSLAHTDSLQSPWSNSNRLLTLPQESTRSVRHRMYHQHSNTLQPSASSFFFFFLTTPLHLLVQFAPSINNSAGNKMEENDEACFLFMVGWRLVQLKVEMGFLSISPPFWNELTCMCVCTCGFSTESKGFSLRRVISEGQPRRHLIRATDSVNGEQNGAGKVVTRAHIHVPLISGVSESTAHSFECRLSHTPLLYFCKLSRWAALLWTYFPRNLRGDVIIQDWLLIRCMGSVFL